MKWKQQRVPSLQIHGSKRLGDFGPLVRRAAAAQPQPGYCAASGTRASASRLAGG